LRLMHAHADRREDDPACAQQAKCLKELLLRCMTITDEQLDDDSEWWE
ncbi:MAG: hypothetical protein IT463_02065, partial [Planctomycetes bacterium]|nr:hypothetical protein [Planctomycetota bacterium]